MNSCSASPNLAEYKYADPSASCAHKYILPRIREILSQRGPGTRLLDLGCGNGALIGALMRPEWEIHAIDSSVSGIQLARQAYPNVLFWVGDVTCPSDRIEYPVGYFDVVISTEVIEHVYAPRKLATNALQALRPGGEIILTTPYHGYLKNLSLALTGHWDAHFTALWDGGHIKFWSGRTLTILLREAGFTEISFYGAGRIPLLWKSMVMTAKKPE